MNRTIAIIVIVVAVALGLGYWIWSENNDPAESEVVTSLDAYNQTQDQDATQINAHPQDVIVYTLTVSNPTDRTVTGYIAEIDIADIAQDAILVDAQGANYNSSSQSLIWTPLDVPANDSFAKSFTVRVKDTLPAESDMRLQARFGNEVMVDISTQLAQIPDESETPSNGGAVAGENETPSYVAPNTGPSENLVLILALLTTIGAMGLRFYRKSKLQA